MKTTQTDFLVIGSGFGAAAPALRLSQAGHSVLMVEKGPNISLRKDLRQTQDPSYLTHYIKSMGGKNLSFTYAEGLGGGSTFYEMVSLRAPSTIFDRKDEDNKSVWPSGLNRAVLDPYYDRAEEMLNVEQIGVYEIPKSGVAFSLLMKRLGYSCDRARYAVKSCIGSGYCVSGCVFGAKQSLHLNYLPNAQAAGMELVTDTAVTSIQVLNKSVFSEKRADAIGNIPFRYEATCVRNGQKNSFKIVAKVIIIAAGTVGTAKILLNSKKSLKNLSSSVGKNIAFNGSVKVLGLLPDNLIEGDMFSGRSHPGMISYHFLKSRGITISSAKPLPLVLTSSVRMHLEANGKCTRRWGDDHVNLMKRYRRKMIVLYALGLTRECAEIVRKPSGKFEPVLNIDQSIKDYYKATKHLLESIFTSNGGEVVQTEMINRNGNPYKDLYFGTTHMVGSCRMADDPSQGVADPNGQIFNYPGLFVSDGSAIPGSLAVNTSLTILANAERISDHLTKRYSAS